jgi:hypothetical protein
MMTGISPRYGPKHWKNHLIRETLGKMLPSVFFMSTPILKDRRKATDHDVVRLVVMYLGGIAIILAMALAFSLIVAVLYTAQTGKELSGGIFTTLVATISGALGAALGYIGGVLSNAFRSNAPVPTAGEIGKGIVEEAAKADGLAVQRVDEPGNDPKEPTE